MHVRACCVQAQKPWAKLYGKGEKSRRDYHGACKAERSAITADKNAAGDATVSGEQAKKLTEKVDRCREEKERARDAYEKTMRELNAYNGKYMEDMTQVGRSNPKHAL